MPARTLHCRISFAFLLLLSGAELTQTQARAAESARGGTQAFVPAVQDLDTPRVFPKISSRKEWQARAQDIHQQVLVSCGLWPMPEKTPLDAHVFGKIDRGDYSIEKVYFQTYPGFFLAGNLYRPLGKGKGPFPAVLNPHGHWSQGRLADEADGSIAARCISFARMGMIAFSYDMVGYNDTHFADPESASVHRLFATNHPDLLWNISMMGLQTWNSIRALDFLASLPDADPRRLACTGASGGGTQTFMLGAADDRLVLQAPIVMVSHLMQGGCLCENAPGLRVRFSNMEIAAQPAPRPQLLVAATGDWTRETLSVEGPSIAHIYELLGAPEKFHYTRFDFPHNYNQTTRQTVYGWFNKWLLHAPTFDPVSEPAYHKEPDSDLRVFPDGRLPKEALSRDAFIESLKRMHRSQIQALLPTDKSSWRRFSGTMFPAWRETLQIDPALMQAPAPDAVQVRSTPEKDSGFYTAEVEVRRAGEDAPIRATYWAPQQGHARLDRLAILSDASTPPEGAEGSNAPSGLAGELLRGGFAVLRVNHFSTSEPADQFSNFYCTYNRTTLQNRVRDLITLCKAASRLDPRRTARFRVTLVGRGHAGLWCLMAAPAADAVVADASGIGPQEEHTLLEHDLFCPGLLALGGFQTAAILAAPHPLLVHNLGANFSVTDIQTAYAGIKAPARLRCDPECLPDAEIARWLENR